MCVVHGGRCVFLFATDVSAGWEKKETIWFWKFFVNCAVRAKKRCDLIPLDGVKPPACFIALCLWVLVSEVHREVAQSCPVFLPACLCASTLHASMNPCYRCLGEIGKEEDKNKRREIVWSVWEELLFKSGSEKWMFKQRRWSFNPVRVHVAFSHIHVNQLLLFLSQKSNFNNFLFTFVFLYPGS